MAPEVAKALALYRRQAWSEAYEAFGLADQASPLTAQDLERLAECACLSGHEAGHLAALERAHRAHLDDGNAIRAARCAFWLGMFLLLGGETGHATGWLARAERLVARQERGCVEHGYLALPAAEAHLAAGDAAQACAAAAAAANAGERFGDADLVACARHLQGRAQLRQPGGEAEGLRLLDEAMVAVTAGEVSPVMTGLIYCSVIDACWQAFEFARASEWTFAMRRWCDRHPQMRAFRGACLVHRAEIQQLHGAWGAALDEARAACEPPAAESALQPPAAAFYRQGEVHRLRGEFAAAERAYQQASLAGHEPQPGLSLLRTAQGRVDEALAAMRRVVGAAADPQHRARLLPAHVNILLAAHELEEAEAACRELESFAARFRRCVTDAMAAQARGALQLARGDAWGAVRALRRAWQEWERVPAPYGAARARELLGLACHALGDDEGGRLERAAARAAFERLGAFPDVSRIDASSRDSGAHRPHGLTLRELDILRLVAQGKTSKTIARELRLSVKTIDRHLSNIFTKLDVPSRAAAIAHAYRNKII